MPFFKKFRFFVLQLVIVLVILEVGLRIYEYLYPHIYNQEVRVFEERGKNYFNKPNYTWKGPFFEVKTNNYGLAGEDIVLKKNPHKKRIAFYGDSFTFGCWATDYTKSFVGIISKSVSNDSVEVINFGCGGYGYDNSYELMKETLAKFQIDEVVFCSTENDFRDTYLGLNKTILKDGVALWNKPVLENKIPKQYLSTESTFQKTKNFLKEYSVLFNYLIITTKVFLSKDIQKTDRREQIAFKVENKFLSSSFWSMRNYPKVSTDAKNISIGYLNKINLLCNQEKIPLMIVTIPYIEQVYSTTMTGVTFDLNYPQKYVRDYCFTKHIPYYELLPDLRSYIQKNNNIDLYLKGDNHFNNMGHQAAAGLILKNLPGNFIDKN
ncbi:hypothetical protein GCM10027049_07770 [Mucilaginibacter puniceus]